MVCQSDVVQNLGYSSPLNEDSCDINKRFRSLFYTVKIHKRYYDAIFSDKNFISIQLRLEYDKTRLSDIFVTVFSVFHLSLQIEYGFEKFYVLSSNIASH